MCDLIDFAAEMNFKLDDINKHSFNEFQLRFLMTMNFEPDLFSSISHNERFVITIDPLLMTTIRIGIAVGALVCGVIGATKPVFDIWGDTVRKSKHHP